MKNFSKKLTSFVFRTYLSFRERQRPHEKCGWIISKGISRGIASSPARIDVSAKLVKLKSYQLLANKGFTLIELILYIALVSIFVTGAIFFAWDIIYGREKAFQQQIVEQNARAALARIVYEIRRADDINSVSSSSIELENGANDTTISLSSGTVQITTGGVGPYDLTSNQVIITSLAFTDLTATSEDTKGINVSLTAQQAATGVADQFEAQTTMSESVELNTQFNDSRSLLIDASSYLLSALLGQVYLQNLGGSNIIIDKITISWTGVSGGNVKEIKIDNVVVWQGEEPSGMELDVTNVTVVADADAIDIEKIDFDQDLSGAVMIVKFTMTDGSSTEVVVDDS